MNLQESSGLLGVLAPAQTALLLRPECALGELLKLTLMDLLLQERLQWVPVESNPVQGETKLSNARLAVGSKFKMREPLLHEMVFLYPFYKKPKSKIVLRHLIQIAISVARSESRYKEKMLMKSPELRKLFKKSRWQKIFGGRQITIEGKRERDILIRQLNMLDRELPVLQNSDPEKAAALVRPLRGNVLLLNSLKFEMLDRLGMEIKLAEDELEEGPPSN